MPKGVPAKFSETELRLMVALRKKGVTAQKIADILNQISGRETCARVINSKLLKLGYPSDRPHFLKGEIPWNRGVTGYMGANVTSFKKGEKPSNTRPVGSTRLDKEGAIIVKVADGKWIRLARLVWEAENGEVPKGYVIFHINSDITDDRIENLTILSRAENLALKRRKWERDKPRYDQLDNSLKPTAILIAKLTVKTREKGERCELANSRKE